MLNIEIFSSDEFRGSVQFLKICTATERWESMKNFKVLSCLKVHIVSFKNNDHNLQVVLFLFIAHFVL